MLENFRQISALFSVFVLCLYRIDLPMFARPVLLFSLSYTVALHVAKYCSCKTTQCVHQLMWDLFYKLDAAFEFSPVSHIVFCILFYFIFLCAIGEAR